MPWRLIQIIITFAIFILLVAFNLGNKCNVSIGFYTFKDVPVFLTAFSAFVLGMLCSLPFVIKGKIKRKTGNTEDRINNPPKKTRNKRKTGTIPEAENSGFSDGGPNGLN